MINPVSRPRELADLEEKLRKVRQQSLSASQSGDFRTVARLTSEAARLNERIKALRGAMD
jgi:hypothetical protein